MYLVPALRSDGLRACCALAVIAHPASLNRRFSRTSVPCVPFRWVEKYRIVALPMGRKVSHFVAPSVGRKEKHSVFSTCPVNAGCVCASQL